MNDGIVEYVELPRFPGYKIGSGGTVWSKWEKGRWKRMLPEYRQLKTPPDNHGYCQVNLTDADRKKRHFKVHILVFLAFHGAKPLGLVCRHKDGDCTNNRADNLAYGTHAENSADTVSHRRSNRGERAWNKKLTWKVASEIRERVSKGEKQNSLASEYKVDTSTICAVVNDRAWVPFPESGDSDE